MKGDDEAPPKVPSQDQRRRELFRLWYTKAYKSDRERLIRKSGLTKGRITQLLDPRQPFGERAAVQLAARLGLDKDSFTGFSPLLQHGGDPAPKFGPSAIDQECAQIWRSLFAVQKEEIIELLRKEYVRAERTRSEMRDLQLDGEAVSNKRVEDNFGPATLQGELPMEGGADESKRTPKRKK